MDTTRLKSLRFRLDSESCRDVHGQVLGPAGAAKSTVACSTWNASSQSAEPFGPRLHNGLASCAPATPSLLPLLPGPPHARSGGCGRTQAAVRVAGIGAGTR